MVVVFVIITAILLGIFLDGAHVADGRCNLDNSECAKKERLACLTTYPSPL